MCSFLFGLWGEGRKRRKKFKTVVRRMLCISHRRTTKIHSTQEKKYRSPMRHTSLSLISCPRNSIFFPPFQFVSFSPLPLSLWGNGMWVNFFSFFSWLENKGGAGMWGLHLWHSFLLRETHFGMQPAIWLIKCREKKLHVRFFVFSHFLPIKGCFLASFLETHSSKRDEGGGGCNTTSAKNGNIFGKNVR